MISKCPRCKTDDVIVDVTELGSFLVCRKCGCEWVEGVPLDFTND